MFDLDLLEEFCREQGVPLERESPRLAIVALTSELKLNFENAPEEDDTFIYFAGSTGGWHSHGELWDEMIELVPITIVSALLDGTLLVVRHSFPSGSMDVSLTPMEQTNDHTQMDPGESVTYYRIPVPAPSTQR